MSVNTRRQTAGLSPLIKVSKKTKKKTIQEPIPASDPLPIPVPEPTDITRSKSITRRFIHRRAIHSIGCFMKHAACGHILGYIYRHTKLDQECWFGSVLFVGFIIFYKHFNNSTLIVLCVIINFFVCYSVN